MALAVDLMGEGLPQQLANRLGWDGTSTPTAVIAAGTAQGTATALTVNYALVTAASSQTGVILPSTAALTQQFIVINSSASTAAMVVYPPTSGTINGGSANAGVTISAGNMALFMRTGTNTWLAWYSVPQALDNVTAGTAAAGKAMVLDANGGIGSFRSTGAIYTYAQAAAGTLNATGTLTAALLLGGIVTSTTAAAVTATLDTGTLLETALIALVPGLQNNDTFQFSVINTGSNGFTIATATGWTNGGGGFTAVAAGTSALFAVQRNSANNYTIFKIG